MNDKATSQEKLTIKGSNNKYNNWVMFVSEFGYVFSLFKST